MQVHAIGKNNSIRFGSGLTKEILRMESAINPRQIEEKFRNLPEREQICFSFNHIDLKNNKTVALAQDLCSKIFINFRNIADYRGGRTLQNLVSPHDIYVFNENDAEQYKNRDMFVNLENDLYEKDKGVFCQGTVFINNKFDSLEDLNERMEKNFHNKIHSSGHFLQPFIHEWIHAIENKLFKILSYTTSGYSGMAYKMQIPTLDAKESEVVADVIGKYASKQESGQYLEVLAEAWAKFICDSLAEDCTSFVRNPVDLMKETPKEFQDILKKVTDIRTIDEQYQASILHL